MSSDIDATRINTVLLVGEASGVHRNLAKGLRELGVDVTHMVQSDAPSWKWYDDVFAHNRPGWRGGVARNLEPFVKIASLPRYDVINFVNTITSVHGLWTRYFDLPLLARKTKVLGYYGLGCDEIGLIRRNPILPYTPCHGCLEVDRTLGEDCTKHLNPLWEKSGARVRKYFNYGASSVIEYDHSSQFFSEENFDRIPFPVDISHIVFTPARNLPKPTIVHTPTRRGFKGTDFVIRAINQLRTIRNDFEFEVVEGLAYSDYVERMAKADIVIDQTNGQSLGINALEMLAAGKIVFSGATELSRGYHPEVPPSPAFDADPDPVVLATALAAALDRKSEYPLLAQQGRSYVENYHDPVKVARHFLKGWSAVLTKPSVPAI